MADSLSLRRFLGYELDEATPDHVMLSRTRRLLDAETHQAVFSWVLGRLAEAGLLRGKTIGVGATTLEANAAMRSIVRRATGEKYREYLRKMAAANGEATDAAAVPRRDRKRKKKASNKDWVNRHDPEAQITKMKDGRMRLAYKAEQAVDLQTGRLWRRRRIRAQRATRPRSGKRCRRRAKRWLSRSRRATRCIPKASRKRWRTRAITARR